MQRRIIPPLTDALFQRASFQGLPLSGTFELTPTCNFACKMCYVRKTAAEVRNSPRRANTLEDWLKLAEEAGKLGMLYVLLTGGEPLSVTWFPELYEALCNMGMLVTINTNGSLIDERMVELFKRCPPRRICITLYGAGDETYEKLCCAKGMYSRVDNAITALREAGITVKLNCSLTPYNVCDLEAMVRYAEERELILDIASYMFPPLRRDESMTGTNDRFTPEEAALWRMKAYRLQYDEAHWQKYLAELKNGAITPPGLEEGCIDPVDGQVRCRAGKASFWVTWDSMLMPCGMMTRPKLDLRKQPFTELWPELMKASSEIRTSGICAKCPDCLICHACAAMALTETGDFAGIPTYLCKMVQTMKKKAEQELGKGCKQ